MGNIKKVLFVVSIYKPNIGGVETSVEAYCREYLKIGIQPIILTKKYPFDLPNYENDNGTEIIRVLKPDTAKEYIDTLKLILDDKRLKADVIHVVGVRRPLPLFALMLARYYKIPIIMTFVGGDVPTGKIESENKIWDEHKEDTINSIMQAGGYSAYSEDIADCAMNLMSLNKKIPIIKTGLDLDTIDKIPKYEDSNEYILSARRLIYSKGIDVLIKAFYIIHKTKPKLKLYIAGDGEEKENLEKLVKNLNLQDAVKFLGSIPLNELYSYMKGAIAHICPSRTEGGGNVNIESSACSCIPIGSNVGGIPEYIQDKKTGLLFENGNFYDLAKKIVWVINNHKNINAMRDNGLQFSKEFSISKTANEYLRIYNQMEPKDSLIPWSDMTKQMLIEIEK